MKKFLALLLTLTMLLSSTALLVCAEETNDPAADAALDAAEAAGDKNSISLFGCNTKWGGMTIDKEDKKAGSASVSFTVAANSIHEVVLETPVDGTGMDTLTFEMYVSDLSLFDKFAGAGMNSGFELTSSGTCDEMEISWYLAGIKKYNLGGDLTVGWNHIVLPLDTATPCGNPIDISKINYIRIFMVGETEDLGITVKFDNLRLDNSGLERANSELDAAETAGDKNSISLFGCNTRWGGMTIDREDKKAGSASASFTVAANTIHELVLETPVDGTGMDTLTFEMYVSDLSLFDKYAGAGMNSGFELTSSGTFDQMEISWYLRDIKACNIGDEIVVGWNHIVLPLDTATPCGNPAFDISNINYIRIFMVGETEDPGITVKFDNLRLDNSGLERAAAEQEANRQIADQVIALIDQIGTVTLESEDAIKAAETAYKKLNAAQAELVTNYATLTDARAKYKELVKQEEEKNNQPGGEEQTGGNEAQKPDDDETKVPENPEEPGDSDDSKSESKSSSTVVIIIVIVAIVVIAAAVCVYFFVIKKKK